MTSNLAAGILPVVFQRPWAFLLLALIALFYVIHRRSLRGLGPNRERLVLGIRALTVLLLVSSLAEPFVANAPRNSAVAFLLDRSDSVSPEQQQWATDWIRQALAAKRAGDASEIIVFAKDALLEWPLTKAVDLSDLTSTPGSDQTNLAGAIRLAISTLPGGMAQQIVVLSDGVENAGNATEEARLAAAAGVPISYVLLSARDAPEVLVREVFAPSTLREQDIFSVKMTVDANVPTSATLYLTVDDRLQSTHSLDLREGSNAFTLSQEPLPKGFHSIGVRIEASADSITENNDGTTYTTVLGKAKVLIVEGAIGEGSYLAKALASGGLDVEVQAPAGVPIDPARFRNFDSLVLLNVRADRLSAAQQRVLKTYVQHFGGGLVAVGGDRSYGAGGYARTTLEEVLPVSMDLQGRKVQSSVALILVLDTSGSMGEGPPGSTKMDLAKKAATDAAALLGPQDQVGILAFEQDWRWHVEPSYLSDPTLIRDRISTLAPGGGTDIFPALREAYQGILRREAKIRHIILMTDGVAPGGDYETLTAQMRRDNITLSTIAIGTDADFGLLQRLADEGKGRYYEGIDPFDVPQLAVKETVEVARAAIVEKEVRPLHAGSSSVLDGVDVDSMPPLAGYVATTAKPTAKTVLASDDADPLLVEWQYGLGQVVAWTSDAENRWAANWLTWPQFVQFWTQVAKRTIPTQLERNLHVAVDQVEAHGRISVESLDDDGSYRNLLETAAYIVDPKEGQQRVRLHQTAPGRYEGTFAAPEQGAYAIEITQHDPGTRALLAAQSTGFVVPYSPEYREIGVNEGLLVALGTATGGGALTTPAQAFVPAQRQWGVRSALALWPFLVAAALVLFLIDVGARRLRVEPADVRRGWHGMLERWRTRNRPLSLPAASRLLKAKQRQLSREPRSAARFPALDIASTAVVAKPRTSKPEGKGDAAEDIAVAAMGARLMEAKRRASTEKP